MSKSRKTTSDNKAIVKPLTKGATLIFPDPIDPKEDKFIIGKPLKDNILLDDLKIPAELAGKSVTDVLIFSTLDPQAGGRGDLTVSSGSGVMTYTKERFSLNENGFVSLILPNMNMRTAVIQFQVSDGNVYSDTIDSDYYISMNDYSSSVHKTPMGFPILRPKSPKKHYLSFSFNAEFDAISTSREFYLYRKQGGWYFYKAKVFILSAM